MSDEPDISIPEGNQITISGRMWDLIGTEELTVEINGELEVQDREIP